MWWYLEIGPFGCEYRFRWGPEIGMPYDRNGVIIRRDRKPEYYLFFFFYVRAQWEEGCP